MTGEPGGCDTNRTSTIEKWERPGKTVYSPSGLNMPPHGARRIFNRDEVIEFHQQGLSIRHIARKLRPRARYGCPDAPRAFLKFVADIWNSVCPTHRSASPRSMSCCRAALSDLATAASGTVRARFLFAKALTGCTSLRTIGRTVGSDLRRSVTDAKLNSFYHS